MVVLELFRQGLIAFFLAKKAMQKKAAAFFGLIRQVEKGSQNSPRDQKKYLNIRISIRPSHFFIFPKTVKHD
jgi:hypothetical protein